MTFVTLRQAAKSFGPYRGARQNRTKVAAFRSFVVLRIPQANSVVGARCFLKL